MKQRTSLWIKLLKGWGWIVLIPCTVFALDPTHTVFQYNCQSWARQNGLSANGINAITQTKDGFIWLGTQKGLVRFDGVEFKSFTLPSEPQFPSQVISTLAATKDGALWFGVQNGLAGSYRDDIGFKPLRGEDWMEPAMNVISIRTGGDASLWIGTGQGTVHWLGSNTNETRLYDQLSGATAIYEDAHGRVWVGTGEQGLSYWESGRITAFPDASLKNLAVFAVAVDNSDQLWVGTPRGLRCYDSHFQLKQILPLSTEVRALLVDRHGTVWIGTSGDGLFCYKNGQSSNFQKNEGLAHNMVTSLFEDREGNLWVGTREGLSLLTDIKLPIYSSTEGLLGGFCHDVSIAAGGGLWMATSHGVSWFDGRQAKNFSSEVGMSTPYVKRIFQARNGDVYLINGDKKLEVLSNGKIVASYANTNWPTAIAEDADGVVVAVGGNLFRASRTQFIPYPYGGRTPPPLYWVRNLRSGRDGSLLIASVNGIFRLSRTAVQHWSVENGLVDNDVVWICEDKDGTIWAGLNTGLDRIKGDRIEHIGREEGLYDTVVHAVVPDDHGSLWVNSSRGIFQIRHESLDAFFNSKTNRVECLAFNGLEAVKTIDTTEVEFGGCKTASGEICFPTPQGVVMFHPDHLAANPVAPIVNIQHVRANGLEITGRDSAALGVGTHELEFEYTAPSFTAPQKVQFRYWLEGYEPGWVQAGGRRSAFFTNLKPGSYRFHVQACNADGVWSTSGDSFEIELPPHFYQSAWLQVLAGLLAGAALFSVYGWRIRHLRQRQQKLQEANETLETKIQKRTRELAEQRNLLRTLIDHLPDNVFVKDLNCRIVLDNLAHARNLGAENPEAVVGKTDFDFFPRELAERFHAAEQKLLASGVSYNGEESSVNRSTGQSRWTVTTKVPLRDSHGKIIGIAGINRDITDRKQAEARLESMHKQLVEASRQAGMADVATSVLHNVGNVLNSVNVSASIVEEKIRSSGTVKLAKVLTLLRENEKNLSQFLAKDEKGKQLITFFEILIQHLDAERTAVLEEMKGLVRNVEHIKEIVVMQQSYTKVAGIAETVKPAELFEDALRMHSMAYERHAVKLSREFAEVPVMTTDRHKVIQILVNLLQNAKYACDSKQADNRKVIVRVTPKDADVIRFEVIDNGVGIPPENLKRIFNHGFTTRKGGHGFGLHSGALAAKEMGGSLTARSDGDGQGATFTLDLPLEYRRQHHAPPDPTAPRDIVEI